MKNTLSFLLILLCLALISAGCSGEAYTDYPQPSNIETFSMSPAWSYKAGGAIDSTPATGKDGTIYFGCQDNRFYAISPGGLLKWTYGTDGWVDSSPAVADDGTIYGGSS